MVPRLMRSPSALPPDAVIFDVFTDVAFLSDILLNFRTGYIEDARIIVDKQLIRRRYLQRWFAIDAAGSFPGDTIFFFINIATTGSPGGVANEASDGGINSSQASLLTLFKVLKVCRPLCARASRVHGLSKTLEVCMHMHMAHRRAAHGTPVLAGAEADAPWSAVQVVRTNRRRSERGLDHHPPRDHVPHESLGVVLMVPMHQGDAVSSPALGTHLPPRPHLPPNRRTPC